MAMLPFALFLAAAAAAQPTAVKIPAIAPLTTAPPIAGLVTGSIFSRDFIERERLAPRTVVFDLDGTLAFMDRSGRFTVREGAVAQVKQLKAQGQRLALWTAQTRQGLYALAADHPKILPNFDVIITGENFIPQSIEGYDDPEFRDAYRGALPQTVNDFYMIGVAKDLSLFDGSGPGRGYGVIVDDNHELEQVSAAAPYGPFSVYRVQPYNGGPDAEPLGRLARSVRRIAKQQRQPPPPSK